MIRRVRPALLRARGGEALEERDGEAARRGRSGTLIPPAGSGEYRIDILREQRRRSEGEPWSPDECAKAPSTVPIPRNLPLEAPSPFEIRGTKSTVPVPESATQPAPAGFTEPTTTECEHEDVFIDGVDVVLEEDAPRNSSTEIRRAPGVADNLYGRMLEEKARGSIR